MKTRYFTFGSSHQHEICGITTGLNMAIKITAPEPREVMFERFGKKWSHEYKQLPEEHFVPLELTLPNGVDK